MTNKEFMQSEIDNTKEILIKAKKQKCMEIVKQCEQDIKDYEGILKNLEVLDILKENATLNIVNKDVKSIQITITTCDDRFQQIEEWLNNEK